MSELTGIERHELEEQQARLTELKAKLAGKIGFEEASDISAWYSAVHEIGCPNCGADFKTFHPCMNLYPHFTGECAPCIKAH
jgi:hypothetical protein